MTSPKEDLATGQTKSIKGNFYSQNFEDIYIWRCFGHQPNGVYVDVGAEQPIVNSVTYKLYLHGWRGINIEPQPQYFNEFEQIRPDDTNLNLAIGLQDAPPLPFYSSNSAVGLAGFGATVHDLLLELGYLPKRIDVRIQSLDQVCENNSVNEIDLLKIDVEGHELQVLKSFAFSRVRPRLVVIEVTKPNTTELRDDNHAIGSLLAGHDYTKVFFDGLNEWWLERHSLELQKHFQIPVNCLDGITPIALVQHQQMAQAALEETTAIRMESAQLVAEADRLRTNAECRQLEAEERVLQVENIVEALRSSTSWKVTKPLRRVSRWWIEQRKRLASFI